MFTVKYHAVLLDELAEFKSKAYLVKVKARDTIFFEEDSAKYIYLVEHGHVKVSRNTRDGKIVTVAVGTAGDFVGAAALLTGRPQPIFAEAITNCQLWRMDGEKLIHMLFTRPGVSFLLASMTGRQLHDAQKTIVNITSCEATQRLSRLLVDLCGKFSLEDVVGNPQIILTHQELANMIGISRQTVTKILGQLQENGYLVTSKRCIEISNYEKLVNYAEYVI